MMERFFDYMLDMNNWFRVFVILGLLWFIPGMETIAGGLLGFMIFIPSAALFAGCLLGPAVAGFVLYAGTIFAFLSVGYYILCTFTGQPL